MMSKQLLSTPFVQGIDLLMFSFFLISAKVQQSQSLNENVFEILDKMEALQSQVC